jgi:membrane protease YdiL (CAAX protease family)
MVRLPISGLIVGAVVGNFLWRVIFGRSESHERPTAGFGFWMAVLWSLLYFVATQIVAGMVFGGLFLGIALVPEFRQHGMDALQPARLNPWLQTSAARAAILCTVAATQFAGLALSWLLLRLVVGRGWKRKIALTRRPTGTHVALILIGMPALLSLGAAIEVPIKEYVPSMQDILDRLGVRFVGLEGSEKMLGELIGGSPWALALFVVGVSPAICEEVFCRGFLGWGLAGRYRAWTVVLIVSFLFGCLHGDPQQGVGAMCLGAAIHGSYLATRSLWVPMFVHWANNSLAVIHVHPKLFPVLQPLEDTLKASPVLFVASAALLFGAVAYALYQTRCKLVPADPDLPTWEPPGVSTVELPPSGSGTVVAHDRLSPASVVLVLVGALAFGLVLSFA